MFSGRSISGEEAKASVGSGQYAVDPEAAALAYFEQHLANKSATALAFALAAVRGAYIAEVRSRLAQVERLYLDRLMQTRDANEGLVAFLAKRQPQWEHC